VGVQQGERSGPCCTHNTRLALWIKSKEDEYGKDYSMERSQPSTDIQKTHKGHKTNTEKTHIDHTGLIKQLTSRDLGVLF
jgi:hypothetical protein